jgi:uncharacterized protein
VAHGIDAAFQPPNEAWHRVSPRLITARRLVLLLVALPLALLAGVAIAVGTARAVWIGVLGIGLAGFGWGWWLIGRRVRSYGYAERDEDLLVTSGIMFRRLTIVPFGRMQLVEVTSGPIDRSFGLTTVRLHTAALTTDATIPGLPPAEASALRDRLSARGEERSAGL